MGIQGNDKVDSLAKAAINIPPDKTSKLPYTDLKQNQTNNHKKMATIAGWKCPKQAPPNRASSERKKTWS